MKQVNELIENARIREHFERYYKAETAEERQAITDEYKRWYLVPYLHDILCKLQ